MRRSWRGTPTPLPHFGVDCSRPRAWLAGPLAASARAKLLDTPRTCSVQHTSTVKPSGQLCRRSRFSGRPSRRFRTGRPCLDLVHTGDEGALARWEIVNDPDDLGRLLGVILKLPALPADDADLAAMRPLRAALTRIAYGHAEGSRPPSRSTPRARMTSPS